MRNERFVRGYESVKLDQPIKEAMLNRILAEKNQGDSVYKSKKHTSFRRLLPVAWAAAILLCVATLPQFYLPAESPVVLQQVAPGMEGPSGIRKTMNYNGARYVFLENGAVYDLKPSSLSASLGTLEYDIQENPKQYSSTELAASFAVGGTIYEIRGYDPLFRLAVEWEGQYYIAQCVDMLDDSEILLSDYFETAGFYDTTEQIRIYDHAGRSVLAELSGGDMEQMLELLAQSEPAGLTDVQYQKIARAQRSGESFLLSFQLKDGTSYEMRVIPSLLIASAGDNRYFLPNEFAGDFSPLFDSLEQPQMPMG